MAFVYGIDTDYYSPELIPEVFFPLLILDPLSAYISSLFLSAFGDLVENSTAILNKLNYTTKSSDNKNPDSFNKECLAALTAILNETKKRNNTPADQNALAVHQEMPDTVQDGVPANNSTVTEQKPLENNASEKEAIGNTYVYTGNLIKCIHCGHMNYNRRSMCEKCGQVIRG